MKVKEIFTPLWSPKIRGMGMGEYSIHNYWLWGFFLALNSAGKLAIIHNLLSKSAALLFQFFCHPYFWGSRNDKATTWLVKVTMCSNLLISRDICPLTGPNLNWWTSSLTPVLRAELKCYYWPCKMAGCAFEIIWLRCEIMAASAQGRKNKSDNKMHVVQDRRAIWKSGGSE